MSAYHVAEYDAQRNRTSKIHRAQRPATAKRNRSQYRVMCGHVIHNGLPVPVVTDVYSLCLHCWPLGGKR